MMDHPVPKKETLQEACMKYRIVADSTYDWEYWIAPDGRYIYMSPSCSRMTGYSVEEFLANPRLFMDIVHPEDRDLIQRHWHEIGEEQGPDQFEFRIVCRDGSIRWIGHVCQPVYDEDGTFLGRRGSNRSITKRKRAEAELLAREKEYRDLVESANSIILRWKPDGEITFFNKFALAFFGYAQEEILGKNVMTLVPDRDSLGQDLSQLAKDVVEHPGRYINNVNENVRSNGDRVWVNWTNRAVVDETGRIREILAIGNDITAQKRMEDELRKSEERYRNLVEQSPDGIAVHSEGRFVYINPAGASILGAAAPEAVVGRSIHDIIHPESLDSVQERIKNTEHGRPTPLKVQRLIRFDGRIFDAEVIGIPFEFGGRAATQIIMRDITERKRAEQDLNRSEERLRAVVDHLPVGVWFADENGKILYGNPIGQKIWSGARWVGPKEFHEYKAWWADTGQPLGPDDWAVARAVRSGEASLNEILDIECFDGSRKTIRNSAVPFYSSEGRLFGVVVLNEDITELRRAEKEVRKSEARLRIAQRSAGAGIWDWDIQTGELDWSPELFGLFGLDPGRTAASFENWRKVLHPEDRRMAEERIAAAIRSRSRLENEYRIVLPSGGVRWISALGNMTYDESGQVSSMSGICLDITERKRAEEETIRLASFPNLDPNPIVEADFEGTVHFLNPAAQALFPELRHRGLSHPWLADWKTFVSDFLQRAGKIGSREVAVEGRYYHQAILFVDETQQFRIYGLDITSLKHTEEELRKSNSRLEILAETAGRLLISGRPQRIINELCRKIMVNLDCQVFFNYLVDEEKDRLRLNAWDGIPEAAAHRMEWLDYGMAVCGCVAREGRRIVAEHIFDTQDPRTDLVRSLGIQAYACHPLMSQGCVIGTLSFGTRMRSSFTEDELALMRAVTDQVSIFMERMRYISDLKAARDDLQKSHDVLESRVRERTEELWRTIGRLETEAAERLRAEEALRESQMRLYDTLESITDGFFTLDRSWRFTYLNEETERIMGRKRAELIGKTLWEIAPMAAGTVFEEQYRKVMIDRLPVTFEALSLLLRVWVEIRAYPTADGIAVYARDITKRKKAEEALQRATAYNRSLIEASPDPLVTIDPDGRISDVNTATENVTGYPRQDLIGTDFSDYFTDPEKAREGYRLVFREGSVRDYALEIRHRDGQVTPVLYNATVYRDEAGKVIGVFADARDITERLKMEEKLRETNEQLRSLASEVLIAEENERRRIAVNLHDHVSQSLAVAKLRLESLQDKASASGLLAPVREVRDLINESIQQTRSLMTELSPTVLYEFGFPAAVEWLTEQIKAKHGVTIEFKSDLKFKRLDQDIQILLFQAVRELLYNIIKHSKADSASISLQELGNYIRIRVKDDGVGFDKARLGNGMDQEGGFGLFSIRERLEHFGGRLDIVSRPGKGTSATIEIPHKKRRKTQGRMRHVH